MDSADETLSAAPLGVKSSHVLIQFGVAALFAGISWGTQIFLTPGGTGGFFWPASGTALAVMVLSRGSLWPGILLGAFCSCLLRGESLPNTWFFAPLQTASYLLGTWLIWRRKTFHSHLSRGRDFFRLLLLGGVVGSCVHALGESLVHWLQASGHSSTFLSAFFREWMDDLLGIVIVAPLILVWQKPPENWLNLVKWSEAGAYFLLTWMVGGVVFLGWAGTFIGPYALGFWIFLVMILGALRLGTHGAMTIAAITAVMACMSAAQGVGFFATDLARTHMFNTWSYLAIIVVAGMSVATNLHERMEAEAESRLSEARFRSYIFGAPIPVLITDERGRYVETNPAAEAMFGYSRAELLRMEIGALQAPSSLGHAQHDFRSLWEHRATSINRDYQMMRKDGTTLWAFLHAVILPDGRCLAYLQDMTARIDMEHALRSKQATLEQNEVELEARRAHFEELVVERTDQLKAANKALEAQTEEIGTLNRSLERRTHAAEAASEAKSRFLANMSHEIRTPLNAILGLTHLVRRQVQIGAVQDKLVKIANSGKHLLNVINDILDLSKIEANMLQIEQVEFDLDGVVENVCSQVVERIQAKGVELVVDLEPALCQTFCGDPVRVGQILLNFLSNAEKFTKRGSILLRGRMINTGAEENLVMFEVKDSGSGISAALLPHLFDPFVQEDASTTRKHGGTGLGLAISKRLAQKMGGDIGVDTVLGQGSTFWFKLRLTPARSTHASPAPPLSRCNIKRALIVDDLAITRLALARLMTGLGIQTEVVASGEMALTTLAEWDATPEPFDLVIIDRNLEGINGLETCRRMRNQNLHSQPAALLITSTTDLHLAEDATAVGFGAVLQKPLTRQSLLEAFNLLEQGGHHAAARALPPSPAELMLARERRGSRILLVEDNLINQEVAKELLEEVGCQVDLAENGVQAIESAKANSYDLILMDLQMPLMDGVAATKAIRANEQTTGRRVPIIAMTANVFVDDRLRCLEAGVDDHVGKPFDPQTLFSRLLQWLPSRDVVPTPLIESRLESSAMDNAEARALLEAVPGFDLEAGLQVVRGRFPSYLNLLRKFLALHEGTMGTFRRLRADGQPVEALRLAHSLIGAAGFLGASRVSEAARNLEKAIHDQLLEAEILEKAAALEKELTVFCAAIRSLPPGVLAPASPMNLHS